MRALFYLTLAYLAIALTRHHRREFGSGAYHYSPRAFRELHGTDEALLKIVDDMIKVLD